MTGDLPTHTHAGTDVTSAAPINVLKSAAAIGTRRGINLIEGTNVTLTLADDAGNDRVNVTIAASAGGGSNHNLLSGTHPDTVAASPVLGDLIAANATPAWQRVAGNTTGTRKFLRQTGTGTAGALPTWDTLVSGDLPAHTHAATDINSGILALARGGTGSDLSATGAGFLKQAGVGSVVSRRFGADSIRETPAVLGSVPAAVRGKRVLVVDETCDTGDTIRLAVAAMVNAGAAEVRTRSRSRRARTHRISTPSRPRAPSSCRWTREVLIDGELLPNPLYAAALKTGSK